MCTGVARFTWLQVPLGFTLGQKGYSHAFAPSTSPAPRFGATRRFDDPRTVWLRPETEGRETADENGALKFVTI